MKGRRFKEQAQKVRQTLTGASSTREITHYFVKLAGEHFGLDQPLGKITSSGCKLWLASRDHLSASTKNQMIRTLRGLFDLALADGVLAKNPMAGIKYFRRQKPMRLTPTPKQFEMIITNLRVQKANGYGAEDRADTVELSGALFFPAMRPCLHGAIQIHRTHPRLRSQTSAMGQSSWHSPASRQALLSCPAYG